jgi:hypothetical protein
MGIITSAVVAAISAVAIYLFTGIITKIKYQRIILAVMLFFLTAYMWVFIGPSAGGLADYDGYCCDERNRTIAF